MTLVGSEGAWITVSFPNMGIPSNAQITEVDGGLNWSTGNTSGNWVTVNGWPADWWSDGSTLYLTYFFCLEGESAYDWGAFSYSDADNAQSATAYYYYTPPNNPPSTGSLTPNSGVMQTGQWTTVSFGASDPDGVGDLGAYELLINTSTTYSGACTVGVWPGSNQLYLKDDSGNVIGQVSAGGSGQVSNARCSIQGQGSSISNSGNDSNATVSVYFNTAFYGAKTGWLYAWDNSGGSAGWNQAGSLTFDRYPSAVSISVPSIVTAGTWTNISFTARDPDGWNTLNYIRFLLNGSLSDTYACDLIYYASNNSVGNLNDAHNNWQAQAAGTTGATADNSYCTLDIQNTTTTRSGTDATVNARVLFKESMAQHPPLNGYTYVEDGLGAAEQWYQRTSSQLYLQVGTPTFSPTAGSYGSNQTVTISTTTTGATIRYTTDGTTPSSTSGNVYSGPVTVDHPLALNAIAYKSGMTDSAVTTGTYVLPVAAPAFSVPGGTYATTQSVTLTTTTPGATIRYTTDGTTPTPTSGTVYSGAVGVDNSLTLKAIAYENGVSSGITTAAYTMVVATPTFSVAAGTYNAAQTVSLSTTTYSATILYTTDGSDPTHSPVHGTYYAAPIAVNSSTTIKTLAYRSGRSDSAEGAATYTLAASTPTFDPPAGTYATGQTVQVLTASPGVSIRYTLDGSTPSPTTGFLYTGPVLVNVGMTVKALAYQTGWTSSAVASAAYTITNNNGDTVTTDYTYTALDQLATVTMTRDGSYTQTRTFTYSGVDLVSATNPENGTVAYTYDAAHRVTTRTDAKGQETDYAYDAYGRLTSQRYYVLVNGVLMEQTAQAVAYTYDSSPYGGANLWGRLGVVNFAGMRYDYSYNTAGRMTEQRLHAPIGANSVDLPLTYTWDNEGRMTSMGYPAVIGGVRNYQYDEMGRMGGMTDENANSLATATYGVADELLTLWSAYGTDGYGAFVGTTETRTYNSLMQMTRQTVAGLMDMEYRYPTGQNNGRITQAKDWVTGEEVTYTYDAVQRLVAAETTADAQSGGWGTSYGYDGFGNLWSKTTTKGSAPGLSVTYDRTTNRQYGVSYDANGNPATVNGAAATWDVENRLGGWTYDPWNRRVLQTWTDGEFQMYGFNLYTPGGQLAVTVNCQQYLVCSSGGGPYAYIAGKRVTTAWSLSGMTAVTDRLGSVRVNMESGYQPVTYYPYGEANANPLPDGSFEFGDVPAGRAGAGLCNEPVLLGESGEVL